MAGNEWLHGECEAISSNVDEDVLQRVPAYVTLDEVLYPERLRRRSANRTKDGPCRCPNSG